jgi:hypothetical protein
MDKFVEPARHADAHYLNIDPGASILGFAGGIDPGNDPGLRAFQSLRAWATWKKLSDRCNASSLWHPIPPIRGNKIVSRMAALVNDVSGSKAARSNIDKVLKADPKFLPALIA